MAVNQVQFQAGMSMREFLERYGTEEQCDSISKSFVSLLSRLAVRQHCLRLDA